MALVYARSYGLATDHSRRCPLSMIGNGTLFVSDSDSLQDRDQKELETDPNLCTERLAVTRRDLSYLADCLRANYDARHLNLWHRYRLAKQARIETPLLSERHTKRDISISLATTNISQEWLDVAQPTDAECALEWTLKENTLPARLLGWAKAEKLDISTRSLLTLQRCLQKLLPADAIDLMRFDSINRTVCLTAQWCYGY